MSFDCRISWWSALGDTQPAARKHIQIRYSSMNETRRATHRPATCAASLGGLSGPPRPNRASPEGRRAAAPGAARDAPRVRLLPVTRPAPPARQPGLVPVNAGAASDAALGKSLLSRQNSLRTSNRVRPCAEPSHHHKPLDLKYFNIVQTAACCSSSISLGSRCMRRISDGFLPSMRDVTG
jgi:hypothetical protein